MTLGVRESGLVEKTMLVNTTANDSGAFSGKPKPPFGKFAGEPGTYIVKAIGMTSGTVATCPFTIKAPPAEK